MSNSSRSLLRRGFLRRGASTVEYALLLVGIMFVSATMFRMLGKQVRKNADQTWAELEKR